MRKYAIIVAGGSGTRMGSAVPKQFLLLHDRPMLYYSLMAFSKAYDDIEIILVLPEEYISNGLAIVQECNAEQRVQVTSGGVTRYHSVQNGLQFVKEESIVFVHDAVRCLVTISLIRHCYNVALAKGSAIPAVTATDTIRFGSYDAHELVDRNNVHIIQTPQTFHSALLLPAFSQPYQSSFTDEASVVEAMGTKVYLVEGEYNNFKITRPVDLIIAASLLQEYSTL